MTHHTTVDGSEIPNNHLGCIPIPVNDGINYQPHLVSRISEPSTVSNESGWISTLFASLLKHVFRQNMRLNRHEPPTVCVIQGICTHDPSPVLPVNTSVQTNWTEYLFPCAHRLRRTGAMRQTSSAGRTKSAGNSCLGSCCSGTSGYKINIISSCFILHYCRSSVKFKRWRNSYRCSVIPS